ncbi:MAG: caspase family protein, partial [Tannerella sp.]|nr:caspase family protein [Tannerella sp.]
QATKEQILRVTKELFAQSRPEDVILFYFSGHGNADRFFVHDTDITSNAVQTLFKEANAQRKLIFADACLSGSFRTSGSSSAPPSGGHTDSRVLLFLSSRSDQNSRESSSLHNGAFTFFLIAGLKGGADANQDRMITAKELYDFVRPRVEEQTGGKQIPVMWGKFEDDMVIMNWKNNR